MNERILVVDDEETIREIVCSMLGAADYRCEEADSGVSALAVLGSDPQFDMVLTGLMMPEVGGLELLERLNSAHPHLPLVFMTAVHDASVALACFRLGAYDYLLKPFEREQLRWTVRTAFANHRQRSSADTKSTLEMLFSARIAELQRLASSLTYADKAALESGLRV